MHINEKPQQLIIAYKIRKNINNNGKFKIKINDC